MNEPKLRTLESFDFQAIRFRLFESSRHTHFLCNHIVALDDLKGNYQIREFFPTGNNSRAPIFLISLVNELSS